MECRQIGDLIQTQVKLKPRVYMLLGETAPPNALFAILLIAYFKLTEEIFNKV